MSTDVAIVTGGAGGLGAEVVRALCAAGWATVALDRSAEGLDALRATLPDAAACSAVVGDAAIDDDVAAALAAASELGKIGLLVNVAGGAVTGGTTLRDDGGVHSLGSFERTMQVNAVATFNATRLVAAAMADNEPDADGQRGVIVNTSSVSGYEGQRGQVAYAAAKAAILGMTLPLARDLAPVGIRVCAIAPGPMGTPVMVDLMERDALESDPTEGIAFPQRMGRPAEFARLVLDIAANPYLNGENIRLDGALRLSGT